MDRHEQYCIEQMARLYMMFTSPVAVFDKANGRMLRISFEWTHPKAKELYSKFAELLTDMQAKNAATAVRGAGGGGGG